MASKGHGERIVGVCAVKAQDNSSTEIKRERSSHLVLIWLTALGSEMEDGDNSSRALFS